MFNLNFDDLKNNIQNLENKVKELEGLGNVPLKELFNQPFLQKYTQFSSLEQMIAQSGLNFNSVEDLKALPHEAMDKFIASNSNFASWKQMLETAVGEFTKNKLLG